MRPIQPVLILTFCVGTFLYLRFARTRTLDRLLLIGAALVGIVMIANPDLTTEIANLIGVGRGTDLLLYFGLTVFGFVLSYLYSRLRSTEARLTELTRYIAIQEAMQRFPPEPPNESL